MASFPWIQIPALAEPGQRNAFASREDQLGELYSALVAAGNAVCAGKRDVRYRAVVYGYEGVGKSALVLEALGLVRGDIDPKEKGQKVRLPPNLAEPLERQRWLIFRFSGKHLPSFNALSDEIASATRQAPQEASQPSPYLEFFQEFAVRAKSQVPPALTLPVISKVLSKEKPLYARVTKALAELSDAIKDVSTYQGGDRTDREERSARSSSATQRELSGKVGAGGSLQSPGGLGAEARGRVGAGTKNSRAEQELQKQVIERTLRIHAEQLVAPLNAFFDAATEAGLPTILVLDDFDDFASADADTVRGRQQVLAQVLGAYTRFRPTAFLLALREEFMDSEVSRQYPNEFFLPPLARTHLSPVLAAWGELQEPALSDAQRDRLVALGLRLLMGLDRFGLDENEAVVIPSRVLPIIVWLARNDMPADFDVASTLKRYLQNRFPSGVVRALGRLAKELPTDDVVACAQAQPVDPSTYTLSLPDRRELEKYGLLRPARAGDMDDPRIVLDPLVALLAASGSERP